MEIEADHDGGDREALDQDLPHEIFRRQRRERRVETQHDRAVEAGLGEQPQLRGLVAQAEDRLVRLEDGARMRLEGQHRGLAPERAGAPQRHVDHGAMAAVDAFEIADRHHRAPEGVLARRPVRYIAASDDEGRPCRRSVDHWALKAGRGRPRSRGPCRPPPGQVKPTAPAPIPAPRRRAPRGRRHSPRRPAAPCAPAA